MQAIGGRGRDLRGSPRVRLVALALAAGVVASVHACDDDSTQPHVPVPGQLLVTLASPNGDEGAAVLEALGHGVDAATVEGGEAFVGSSFLHTRIVALLAAPGEIRITLDVDDLERPPELRIVQVADGANELRLSLIGYSLELETLEPAVAFGEVSR